MFTWKQLLAGGQALVKGGERLAERLVLGADGLWVGLEAGRQDVPVPHLTRQRPASVYVAGRGRDPYSETWGRD